MIVGAALGWVGLGFPMAEMVIVSSVVTFGVLTL